MSIGHACGGYFLTAGNGESGFGNREPSAGSRKSALRPCLPLSRGGWRAPIYSLAPHCLSGGRGPRSGEGGLPKARREPAAGSQQPTAGSLHYALAPLSRGGWRAPIYSLAPHCLSGGRGPRSGEGGLPKARRQPPARSQEPAAGSPKPAARR